MPPRKWNDAQERAILEEYKAGATCRALAERWGGNANHINQVARRHGVKGIAGRRPYPLSEEQVAEMASLRLSGASLQEIADSGIFGCGRWTINNLMNRMCIQSETPKRPWRGAVAYWAWRGGLLMKKDSGYVLQLVPPDDPMHVMAGKTGYVLQHRLVVGRSLGRPLTSAESVHHINGDRRDNRLKNLQLRQHKHGRGVRHRCADCGSYNVLAVGL